MRSCSRVAQTGKTTPLSPEMKRRLSRRDALLKDLEKQAEEMEFIVWRELTASKPHREKISSSEPINKADKETRDR